ncbi:DNA-formamidopyrimidine glycosylase [Xanthomonas fragariae]|uniref:DNA-formamidopyrimidine glycosylase n=1 Tax=Xanthomonas fragariae TaxID=48664 RepID=A0A1Y6HF91_9XANT|nr:hypothetical protein PD885_03483 [Xanthomonas fragariae]SMR01846.1 DNA-formamidopyrimidine glycosylase [Xanthomonas fragariae]
MAGAVRTGSTSMHACPSVFCVQCDHDRLTCGFDTRRMPEGPSLVILREQADAFAGRKILHVSGNSKQEIVRLHQQKVLALRSWGKHF